MKATGAGKLKYFEIVTEGREEFAIMKVRGATRSIVDRRAVG